MNKSIFTLTIALASLFSTAVQAELKPVSGLTALRELTTTGTGYANGIDVQLTSSYFKIKAIGISSQLVPIDKTHPITSTSFMAVADGISTGGYIILDPELCDAVRETMEAAMEKGKADYTGWLARDFTFGEGASFTKAYFPCRYYINANGMPMLGIADSETMTTENTQFTAQGTFPNSAETFTPQMATKTETTKYHDGNDPEKYLCKYVKLYNPDPENPSSNVSMEMTGCNGDDNMTATVRFNIDEYEAEIDPVTGAVIKVLHDSIINVTNTVRVKDVFHYYSDDLKPSAVSSITGIFAKELDETAESGYSYVIYLYGDEPLAGYKTSGTTAIKQVGATTTDTKAYYTLSGQRIAHPTKGVFIHGGKKVTLK